MEIKYFFNGSTSLFLQCDDIVFTKLIKYIEKHLNYSFFLVNTILSFFKIISLFLGCCYFSTWINIQIKWNNCIITYKKSTKCLFLWYEHFVNNDYDHII